MKVAIYAIDFAPKIGGEETYLLLLAEGLASRMEQERRTVTPSGHREPGTAARNWNLVLITRTAVDGFDDSILPYTVVRRPSLAKLWRLLREADIVHVSGPVLLPLLLGVLLQKPLVIQHHTYHSVCPQGLFLYGAEKAICPGHFMARRYNKCLQCNAATVGWPRSFLMLMGGFLRYWLCKRASANVGVTNYVSHRIALPQGRTVDHGVCASLAGSHGPFASSFSAGFSFAYVGRLVEEKGVHLLVQTAKQLKHEGNEFRLKFIGDGPERAALETSVAELSVQDRVQFTGFLRGAALESALADVAVVVMPSMWEETAGLAAIEQMMRGRLVIVAEVGGLSEVVGDAGLKFPVGDVTGLVARMRQVLNDPRLVAELGSRAYARAKQLFCKERMLEQQYRLFQEVMQDHLRQGLYQKGHRRSDA